MFSVFCWHSGCLAFSSLALTSPGDCRDPCGRSSVGVSFDMHASQHELESSVPDYQSHLSDFSHR